ncbi:MAG: hypothetical protein GX111_13030 [Clostridiales bacterium]|nr:hypothetical protein [Clostridiales bacterium]
MWRNCRKIGIVIIGLGVTVIVVTLLPSGFWFFAVGIFLILCGLAILKK